jgi:hypothetical protein
MNTIKIVFTHLTAWFLLTGVAGMIFGPSIDTGKIDSEKISQGIPTSIIAFSAIYFLVGWVLPYRYFNKKNT